MMIIVLPAGYILRCLDDAEPQLTESKVIKGRMAVCWLVTPNSDKVKFSLRLERTQCTISELRTHCSALNKEVMERPSGKNLRIPEPKNLPAESSAFPVKSISMRDKLLVFITCGIFILGTLITIGSFILIFLDSSASTSIKMFGQSLTTTNVGIVTLFLGIVMIVITIREVFNVLRSDFS